MLMLRLCVCVWIVMVLLMSRTHEIESTGRYLCGDCEENRVIDAVAANWHTERGLTVTPLAGSVAVVATRTQLSSAPGSCAPTALTPIISLSARLNVLLVGWIWMWAFELFTRLDHEGLYCQQCVGNQARERCTVDCGIGIMEVVRANVVSDVAVDLG